MAMTQWEKLARKTKTNLLSEGVGSAEFTGYIDTGAYTLNMINSGSLFNGIPNNSFTGLAGETSTGKTFFALAITKHFLDADKNAGVLYVDTESAVRRAMAENRGMETHRITGFEPDTVEEYRTKMLEYMAAYAEIPEKERFKMIAVLDSMGNLSTIKEITDTGTFGDTKEAEKRRTTKDMTKPGILKGTFRLLRTRMAKLHVPMLITDHVYANIGGYGPTKEIAGGSGLKYAADMILMLTKAKAREGDTSDGDVIGSKITVKAYKSRLGRENAEVQVLLNYDTGLDRYYGLMDMAVDAGVFQKATKGLILPGGTAVSRKEILKNPEQVYTMDVLKAIDEAASPMYRYGTGGTSLPYVDPDLDDDVEAIEA